MSPEDSTRVDVRIGARGLDPAAVARSGGWSATPADHGLVASGDSPPAPPALVGSARSLSATGSHAVSACRWAGSSSDHAPMIALALAPGFAWDRVPDRLLPPESSS